MQDFYTLQCNKTVNQFTKNLIVILQFSYINFCIIKPSQMLTYLVFYNTNISIMAGITAGRLPILTFIKMRYYVNHLNITHF